MDNWQIEDSEDAGLIRSKAAIGHVELFTKRRQPFESKGTKLAIRNKLRSALEKLEPSPGKMLEARYVSTDVRFVDTENVLLYNIGTSALALPCRFGVRFKREFNEPPVTPDYPSEWRHYHSYTFVPHRRLDHLMPSALWHFELPKLNSSLKAHDFWKAAKESLARVSNNFNNISGPFRMTLEISGPQFRGNCAALVKPLFDGVIAALHYDPSIKSTDSVCIRLAEKLCVTPVQISEHLCNSANAILGHRKVVRPTATFVAWNPEDERCHIGEMLIQNSDSPCYSVEITVSPIESFPDR